MDNRKKSWLFEIKNVIKGKNKKLIIADRPDIFFNKNTKPQVINTAKPIWKSKAKTNPNDVATPLPPLKLLNTENICPNNINNENI